MKYPNLIEHFEMIMAHVQDESYAEAVATIATFKNRLVELEEKLSEFQNGLPIEKAKELDEVLIIGWDSSSTDGVFWQEAIGHVEGTYLDAAIATWTKVPTSDGTYRYEWFDENNGVIYKNPKAFFTPPVLPSTETKEGD